VTRVTLDSNVYISALVFGGKPKRLLDLAAEGVIISSVSRPILEEVKRVLLTKFLWSDDRVQEALSTIHAITEYVSPTEALAVVKEDPDDDRILEAAVAGLSEVIVTGDAGLLSLARFHRASIMTVSQALARFDRETS